MSRSISTLFERRKHARVYPTMRAELDAVRSGAKAMAVEVWPRDSIDEDPDHHALVRLAYARGLQVIHQADEGRAGVPIVAVYVLHPEDAWRVPAHRALWQVFPAAEGSWSDGAEALEGYLLGYSDRQRAAWLAEKRHERCGWRGTTIYLLLTKAQRRILAATGNRYLHPDALAEGVTAVWCDGTRVVRKRAPAWVARDQLVLARVAIADATFRRVLGEPRGPVTSMRLTVEHARPLNAGLESKVELLGVRGWR